jgi:simple sugar transport system permease protein
MAVPLLYASLGEIVVEKSGVINVGIEGMMLSGAFAGYAVSQITQNACIGLAAAIAAGIMFALVFALLTVVFRANQVVVGTAVNILALGLTGVLYAALANSPISQKHVPSFGAMPIPLLSHMPFFGRVLFSQDALTYSSIAALILVTVFLGRTVTGLRLRACGEYPDAADAAGVNVNLVRTAALVFGGAMAGIAGAHMSIAYTVSFVQGMTNGNGFIALAVVIVGRWKPAGALIAALLFGLANALQFDLQAIGAHVPYQLVLALPYIATLGALSMNIKRFAAAPTMLGAAYERS